MAFLDITLPNKEEIADYKEKLAKKSIDTNEITKEDFIQVECWFDKTLTADATEHKVFIHDLLKTFDVLILIRELIRKCLALDNTLNFYVQKIC